MKNALLVIISVFVFSCASSKFIAPTPTQSDAETAAVNYPGITLAELNEGKMHYEANCSKCHGLKNPAKFSVEKLTVVVPKMVTKANTKAKKEVITPAMQASILKYMVTMRGAKKG